MRSRPQILSLNSASPSVQTLSGDTTRRRTSPNHRQRTLRFWWGDEGPFVLSASKSTMTSEATINLHLHNPTVFR
jgi:hypothetical protein